MKEEKFYQYRDFRLNSMKDSIGQLTRKIEWENGKRPERRMIAVFMSAIHRGQIARRGLGHKLFCHISVYTYKKRGRMVRTKGRSIESSQSRNLSTLGPCKKDYTFKLPIRLCYLLLHTWRLKGEGQEQRNSLMTHIWEV